MAGVSGGSDVDAGEAARARARASYEALVEPCGRGKVDEVDATLEELAAARAKAVGGCVDAARTEIVLEAVNESDYGTRDYVLTDLCGSRSGGDGPEGWIAVMRRFVEVVGDDAEALVSRADDSGATALHAVCCPLTTRDDALMPASIAGAACLLAHGADPAVRTDEDETPRDYHIRHAGEHAYRRSPALMALLELAEGVGGRAAVFATLVDTPHVLTDAPGWDVVRTMPRLQELQDAANLRIIIALWADARLRVANGEAAREGNLKLRVLGLLHRNAFGELLRLIAMFDVHAQKKKKEEVEGECGAEYEGGGAGAGAGVAR
mmetsp:Transcript_15715/g.54591  ORF Transcript_15715/g.54591 Transcript_15715/m.54591 type:complete len:322 (-) Transcript_15715:59-1024(-)